jgi:hypothetical protein
MQSAASRRAGVNKPVKDDSISRLNIDNYFFKFATKWLKKISVLKKKADWNGANQSSLHGASKKKTETICYKIEACKTNKANRQVNISNFSIVSRSLRRGCLP